MILKASWVQRKGPGQVDIHHRLPLLVGHIFQEGRWWTHTGVVEQEVQPSELSLYVFEEAHN